MAINYLEGIQPGQIINLDRFKQKEKVPNPENYLADLETQLESMAQTVNEEFPGFLEKDGKISLAGEDVESDSALLEQQEMAWAQECGKTLGEWKKDKEKNPANITEMALTIVFNKFLRGEFVVARASDYDDYNNGVDQIIIDKKTGAVVCGFDEVIGKNGDDGGEKKSKKINDKMESGGSRIKYGATIREGELVRKELKNIPTFYVSISKEELNQILLAIRENKEEPTVTEEKAFAKLISSLEEQSVRIEKSNLNNTLRDNLDKFKASLAQIKKQEYLDAA